MAYRVLEVTLLSAKDLKNVNLIMRMEVYAVATISGDPLTRQCTLPDPYGGRHPTWNATLWFAVPPTASVASGCLHILLRADRALGDRDVGEVIVPLADILSGAGAGDLGPRPQQFASYQVRKVHRTETRGVLDLTYRLGPVIAPQVKAVDPVVAYPPFHPQAYTSPPALPPSAPPPLVSVNVSMPPPSQAAGHVAVLPSPQASGHVAKSPPPKAAGHVAVPRYPQAAGHVARSPPPQAAEHVAVPPPPKAAGHVAVSPRTAKNNGNLDFGMGLGAGLAGGMMAGNMMSDGAAYDTGNRVGLADGGGAEF